ncbi:hypothetical protein F2Q70_00034388 [Brassica cretica]|uniref:Uncharacterized protein n=1 Tax=Brassica cretica TaxID=69181 RepID=A0A3N6RFL5_BRACR|nr:hypothetical protein F2Q70_00034388 [Brassica cretica]KAF3529076.1 hypothetical protein DY000_02037104 [Brassica cretica]
MRNTCFTDTSTFHRFGASSPAFHRSITGIETLRHEPIVFHGKQPRPIEISSKEEPKLRLSRDLKHQFPIEISFLALISCIGEHPIDPVEISSNFQRIKAINPSIAGK